MQENSSSPCPPPPLPQLKHSTIVHSQCHPSRSLSRSPTQTYTLAHTLSPSLCFSLSLSLSLCLFVSLVLSLSISLSLSHSSTHTLISHVLRYCRSTGLHLLNTLGIIQILEVSTSPHLFHFTTTYYRSTRRQNLQNPQNHTNPTGHHVPTSPHRLFSTTTYHRSTRRQNPQIHTLL